MDKLLDRNSNGQADRVNQRSTSFDEAITLPSDAALKVFDVYNALETAFKSFDASTWRFANPFHRALVGSLEFPASHAVIYVHMKISAHPGLASVGRLWRFETQAARS